MTLFRDDDKGHEAARDRLDSEPIIWLSTVTGTGQPQATPVWFIWTAGEVVIYGARNGPKNRNIAANPRVCLHLDGDGRGGSNVILEGTARIDPDAPKADQVPAYLAKYQPFIDANGWTPASFARDYPHVIRVTPTRVRVW